MIEYSFEDRVQVVGRVQVFNVCFRSFHHSGLALNMFARLVVDVKCVLSSSPSTTELELTSLHPASALVLWVSLPHISLSLMHQHTTQVLEYFQTLDLEITLVWPTSWTLVKGLYILNRYLVFIPVCLCIYCEHTCLVISLASS